MPTKAPISISVVISVHNGGLAFRDCLASLVQHRDDFEDLIVVDDGSTDDALMYAAEAGARILRVVSRRGPAHGRNVGISAATGDVVLLLDSDVRVADDTISKIWKRFEDDPELGAVFGSYDTEPSARGLVSQFRNLLHCYVHQTSKQRATTFWAGCGAIRRNVILESGGFDTAYTSNCVEDLELGMRLASSGVRIALDPSIQVKHLKRWTLRGMIVTDIWRRGIPWTRLILASRRMPDDLNLRRGARASVALTGMLYLLAALPAARALFGGPQPLPWSQLGLLALVLAAIGVLNLPFYRFLASQRGLRFAVISIPLHLIYFSCCGISFTFAVVGHYRAAPVLNLSTRLLPRPGSSEE